MVVTLFQLAIVMTTIGIVRFRDVTAVQVCLSLMLIWIFFFSYINSTDVVAQDRFAYYLWYLETSWFGITDKSDQAFSFFLTLFPVGMEIESFSAVFGVLLIAPIVGLYLLLCYEFEKPLAFFALALAILFFDRVFIGLLFNTSRSALSGTLFCVIFAKRSLPLGVRLGFVALSAGVHFAVFTGLASLYLCALVFRYVRFLQTAVLVGVGVFVAKYVTGFVLIDPAFFEIYSGELGDSRFARAVDVASDSTSFSRFVQNTIGILIPVLLITFRPGKEVEHTPRGKVNWRVLEDDLLPMRFALMCVIAMLFFYPEILLLQRIAIGTILLFPFLARESDLMYLLVFKSLILLAIYGRIIEPL